MPWRGVTVTEQRERSLADYKLNGHRITDLAECFGVSRRIAHKGIDRFEQAGESGFRGLSRRPYGCPGQTDTSVVEELVHLFESHTRAGVLAGFWT